jgi:precorrin-8X/cobalt-precorrin-8 methylmutase
MEENANLGPGVGGNGLVEAGRDIERESFRIIEAEVGEHSFSVEEWPIVRRVIHTTGDFDYARWIRFQAEAIARGTEALRRGAAIVTDTRMIRVGLAPWRLSWFDNEVVTPAEDPNTRVWADQLRTTRSVAALRKATPLLEGSLVVVGNAPTALLEIIRLIREEQVRPALVVGVPVGFVQAAESKEELRRLDHQPAITVLGRKGGSPVAVAVVHALLELARNGGA